MSENLNSNSGGGLSIAAMVLGIIGIVLSFIPIINNIAFVLGILALIFGIIGIARKVGKGKAIAGLVLGILSIIITLVMQNAVSVAVNEVSKELDKAIGSSSEEVLKKEANVTLGDFQVSKDEYDLTDTKMVVTVKNITNNKKSFSFHIEAVDASGNRINDDYIYANDLGAGQTQEFEIFKFVENSKIDAMQNATFKIVEASSY